MPLFRKKPVVINAVQFNGDVMPLIEEGWNHELPGGLHFEGGNPVIRIQTLEGVMTASVGDWIIRGVKGEFYPCKPDIFDATYEPANGG